MSLTSKEYADQRSPPAPVYPDNAVVYLCVLCDELLSEPVQSSCGDRMCQPCLKILKQNLKERGLSSTSCPGCGNELDPSECFPDRAASRDLSVLVVTCPALCSWSGSYKDYPAHYPACPQRPRPCPHCALSITADKMAAHQESCPSRPVQCPHCSQEYMMGELEMHQRICPYKPVQCEHCGKRFPGNQKETHLTQECTGVERKCQYYTVGCTFKGRGDALTKHEKNKTEDHLRMVTRAMASQGPPPASQGPPPATHKDRHIEATIEHMVGRITELTRQVGGLMTEVQRLRSEEQGRAVVIEDGMNTQQKAIRELQDCHTDRQCCCSLLWFDMQLNSHIREDCVSHHSACRYQPVGCEFEGCGKDMLIHEEKYTQVHLRMVWKRLQSLDGAMETVHTIISGHKTAIEEMDVEVQTLQAASYGPVYIWRIPDLARRRRDAILGHTVSIYSAPFYTSRHGYKLCLRVYLNGDGSGRSSHLSLFMTMMRGDYDALLPWPFRQTTTLSLMAQDRALEDITQSFKPDESSTSFHRPQTEMNVASVCPKFCPLSVLDNPGYVKDEVLFIKCVVSTKGLDTKM